MSSVCDQIQYLAQRTIKAQFGTVCDQYSTHN